MGFILCCPLIYNQGYGRTQDWKNISQLLSQQLNTSQNFSPQNYWSIVLQRKGTQEPKRGMMIPNFELG